MATNYQIKATLGYEDGTSRSYTIGGLSSGGIQPYQIAEKVKALNVALGGGTSTIEAANEYAQHMPTAFVSADGDPLTKIEAVQTIETTEVEVYNG